MLTIKKKRASDGAKTVVGIHFEPFTVINSGQWSKREAKILGVKRPAWWKFWVWWPNWGIKRHQRKLGMPNFEDSHSRGWLGAYPVRPGRHVKGYIRLPAKVRRALRRSDDWLLDYTFPRCKLTRWEEIWLTTKWTAYEFEPPPITSVGPDLKLTKHHFLKRWPGDLEAWWYAALMQWGRLYDVPQLISMGLVRLLGYDVSQWTTFFDLGARFRVCSAGLRVGFEYVRKAYKRAGTLEPYRKLFSSPDGVNLVHVERTTPGHFANSPEWFTEVASWRDVHPPELVAQLEERDK